MGFLKSLVFLNPALKFFSIVLNLAKLRFLTLFLICNRTLHTTRLFFQKSQQKQVSVNKVLNSNNL